MKRWAMVWLALALAGCSRQPKRLASVAPVFETQVKNAVRVGDGDEAIQALRQRLLGDPRNTALRRQLADRFEAAGYPDLALEHLRLAHDAEPADASLTIDLARKLNAMGYRSQADQILTEALVRPDPPAALLTYAAITKDGLGDWTSGEALHRRALALHPSNGDLENNLAFNLMRQGRGKEAESIWRTLLERRPTYELARNNLAHLYATQLKNPEEAIAHWKAASGPAAAHNNLAAVYLEQGRNEDARRQLEMALAMRFHFPEAVRNLQILAARTGGTVDLKLKQDKRPSSLSKLAKAIKTVFVTEDEENRPRTRRSN